jgi:anti-anti-sigma factor
MEIVITQESNAAVFALSGRLDAVSSPQLEEKVSQWFEQPGKKLIFDLQGLEYISSAGLRVFLATAKKMKTRDGQFCMAGLRENVKDVFTISGFISLIPAFNSVKEALESIR